MPDSIRRGHNRGSPTASFVLSNGDLDPEAAGHKMGHAD